MKTRPTLRLSCPQCGAAVEIGAVQGDRCPGCGFEFTVFEPGQELVCQQFYEVLTQEKHLVDLGPSGRVVVHR